MEAINKTTINLIFGPGTRSICSCADVKKPKASHTRYQALGPELIPVYRQSSKS